MERELTSAAEVMDALGGIDATARIAGARYKAAANWKSFNRFPSRTFVTLTRALRERGLCAPASLWGMAQAGAAA